MTRLEKCKLLKSKGYKYDPNTGLVFGLRGKNISSTDKDGYLIIGGGKKFNGNLKLQHFAWYMIYDNVDYEMLDHINEIKSDNRISNLRISNNSKNQMNRFTTVKGYTQHKKTKRWCSRIKLNGKLKHIACFETEEEARQSYLQAKEKYHII